MATSEDKSAQLDADIKQAEQHQLPIGVDDAAPIPKGQIDPVYEAKARVLNHAVRLHDLQQVIAMEAS
jgi:hypothetical protein